MTLQDNNNYFNSEIASQTRSMLWDTACAGATGAIHGDQLGSGGIANVADGAILGVAVGVGLAGAKKLGKPYPVENIVHPVLETAQFVIPIFTKTLVLGTAILRGATAMQEGGLKQVFQVATRTAFRATLDTLHKLPGTEAGYVKESLIRASAVGLGALSMAIGSMTKLRDPIQDMLGKIITTMQVSANILKIVGPVLLASHILTSPTITNTSSPQEMVDGVLAPASKVITQEGIRGAVSGIVQHGLNQATIPLFLHLAAKRKMTESEQRDFLESLQTISSLTTAIIAKRFLGECLNL